MNLSQWDAELHAINNDLNAIRSLQQDAQQRERLSLISLKVSIFQLQGRLSAILDKIKTASERITLISDPKAKSLLHWSGVYAEKARAYYFQLVQLLGKQMWLKLIRTRMPGFSGKPTRDFSDEHLIELSIRHKQLIDTEVLLNDHLAALTHERQKLWHHYEDVCAIQANRDAAGSMQANFGRSFTEAMNHPVISRVKSTFVHLAQAARPVTSKYRYLMDVHQDVSQRIDRIIQHCKTLVVADLNDPIRAAERLKTRELDHSLRQISELREQLAIAESLFTPTPQAFHPTLKPSAVTRVK